MLIDFFYTLRSAKLPVSVKEYLTLLEAIKEGVVGPNTRTMQLQDRRLLLPEPHRAGQGREALRQVRPRLCRLLQGRGDDRRLHQGHPAGMAAQEPGAQAEPGGKGQDREDGLGRAHGDAEEALRRAEGAPRRRQQDDRHRRHQPVRRQRLQPAGHPHRPGERAATRARSRSGTSAPTRTTTTPRSWARATSRSRCAACASSPAKATRKNSTWTTPSAPLPPMPAGWTSRWCPSATTT
jgi:hypothetical protein